MDDAGHRGAGARAHGAVVTASTTKAAVPASRYDCVAARIAAEPVECVAAQARVVSLLAPTAFQ